MGNYIEANVNLLLSDLPPFVIYNIYKNEEIKILNFAKIVIYTMKKYFVIILNIVKEHI